MLHPQATTTNHSGPRISDLSIERRRRNHFNTYLNPTILNPTCRNAKRGRSIVPKKFIVQLSRKSSLFSHFFHFRHCCTAPTKLTFFSGFFGKRRVLCLIVCLRNSTAHRRKIVCLVIFCCVSFLEFLENVQGPKSVHFFQTQFLTPPGVRMSPPLATVLFSTNFIKSTLANAPAR